VISAPGLLKCIDPHRSQPFGDVSSCMYVASLQSRALFLYAYYSILGTRESFGTGGILRAGTNR